LKTAAKEEEYHQEVMPAVKSYRAQNPSLQIALATSILGLCKDKTFEHYIYVNPKAMDDDTNHAWKARLMYTFFTPFAVTLSADTDTLCCSSLDDLFEDTRADIACGTHHPKIFTPVCFKLGSQVRIMD
jgi:hypothetical protein